MTSEKVTGSRSKCFSQKPVNQSQICFQQLHCFRQYWQSYSMVVQTLWNEDESFCWRSIALGIGEKRCVRTSWEVE